jgi:hypothetical protein
LGLWEPFFEGDFPPDSLHVTKNISKRVWIPMDRDLIPNPKDIIRSKNI